MRLLLLLLLPCLLIAGSAAATAADPPLRVTTDGPEYCGQLHARVIAQPGAAQDPARSLAEEGLRLCDSGHSRTGIAKLRRALRAAQGMS
jgi:hypothetical protein